MVGAMRIIIMFSVTQSGVLGRSARESPPVHQGCWRLRVQAPRSSARP